jgi:hypothetical protein
VKNETVVKDDRALKVFKVRPRGIVSAIQRALINEDREFAETRWSDALSSSGYSVPYGGVTYRNRLVDSRVKTVPYPARTAFQPIQRIGGDNGWYCANWLWSLRGFIDLLVGGVGVRRGRRHPREISPGDAIDFWRVEQYKPNRLLILRAEMKLPGRAWLQFEVHPETDSSCSIHQTAVFDPIGLSGLVYWYALYPIHQYIFSGMLRNIATEISQDENQNN